VLYDNCGEYSLAAVFRPKNRGSTQTLVCGAVLIRTCGGRVDTKRSAARTFRGLIKESLGASGRFTDVIRDHLVEETLVHFVVPSRRVMGAVTFTG